MREAGLRSGANARRRAGHIENPMSSCYLFENGTIIDGTGAAARPGAVLVENEKIAAIGEDAARRATGDVTRIDARGMTVMPGLIDAHVHLSFDDAQSNAEIFHQRRGPLSALVAAYNARKVLRAGVTSILDPDSVYECMIDVRDAIESGVVGGSAHRVRRLRADDVGRRDRRPPHSRSRRDRLGQGAEGQGRDRRRRCAARSRSAPTGSRSTLPDSFRARSTRASCRSGCRMS